MKYETTRAAYYYSMMLFALDRFFSVRQFKKTWIRPTKGFSVADYSSEIDGFWNTVELAMGSEIVGVYSEFIQRIVSREGLPVPVILSLLHRSDIIVKPFGWPKDCLITTYGVPDMKRNRAIPCFLICKEFFADKYIRADFSFKLTRDRAVIKLNDLLDLKKGEPLKIKKFFRKTEVIVKAK